MDTMFIKGTEYVAQAEYRFNRKTGKRDRQVRVPTSLNLSVHTAPVPNTSPFSRLMALFPVHFEGRPSYVDQPVITLRTSNPATVRNVTALLAAA